MLVAHGWLHGGYPRTGMQSPIESEFKIPSLNLDTIKQQQKQTYGLRNVRTGYVLYRALVFLIFSIYFVLQIHVILYIQQNHFLLGNIQ